MPKWYFSDSNLNSWFHSEWPGSTHILFIIFWENPQEVLNLSLFCMIVPLFFLTSKIGTIFIPDNTKSLCKTLEEKRCKRYLQSYSREWVKIKTSELRYEAVPGSACLPLSFTPLMGLSEPSGSPVGATTSSQVYIWGSERDSWVGASGCDLGVLVSATALHPCVTASLFASGLKWNSQNCCFIRSIGWETLGPPVPG